MRRMISALAVLLAFSAWVGASEPARASCAGTATFEELAALPAVAVFTGRATGATDDHGNVEFAVDRWFKGPDQAPVVYLAAYSVGVDQSASGGIVGVVLAEVIAGDAITLTAREPVLMVASWDSSWNAWAADFCTVAGVALASPEGKGALSAAVAVFGPGRAAADLPTTDTLAPPGRGGDADGPAVLDWWPLLAAFAIAVSLVFLRRRLTGHAGRSRVA